MLSDIWLFARASGEMESSTSLTAAAASSEAAAAASAPLLQLVSSAAP